MNLPLYVDDSREPEPRPLPLVWFVLLLAGCGVFLYAIAGLPRLPERIPSWVEILVVLQGSDVPLGWFAYAFTTAAWVLWIWIVASLIARLLAGVANVASGGATWAKSLRAATDRFTLPIVRRVVDGAVVAVVVVNLFARTPAASAAPLTTPTALVANAPHPHPTFALERLAQANQTAPRVVEYTVVPGDTLWSIAARFYGTGEEYPRLVDANAGRRMPDGRIFTRAGVVQPGWVLRVPLPSTVTHADGRQTYYFVEKGDTLRGIAARFLGDENRWPAIFDLNRGQARLPDGRVLKNPDLIWPGLRLRLPSSAVASAAPASATAPAPSQPPSRAIASPEPDRRPPPPEPAGIAPSPPSPTVTIVTPIPTPRPTARITRDARSVQQVPRSSSLPLNPIEAAAGLAVLGGAGIIAARRFRRNLDEPSDETTPPPVTLCNDFLDADLARPLAHRLQTGAVESVEAIAESALRFFHEQGEDDVRLILTRQTRDATALLLDLGPRTDAWIEHVADELGARLGGHGFATRTSDGDVLLKLAGLKLVNIVVSDRSADGASDRPVLLPLGVSSGKETVSVNWSELGHVLVAAQPGDGADVVLTSMVASLAARCRPDELRLVTIARPRGLADTLERFPHQARGVVNLEDPDAVSEALSEIRAELLRRVAADDEEGERITQNDPRIVVMINDLAAIEDDGTTLELLGTHGPSHGIQLLAASSQAEEPGDDLLVHFDTRLVLQTVDDGDSIRLLGRPDAADLGSAEFYLRVEGRAPVRLRGFRVSETHLEELVKQMNEEYGVMATEIDPSASPSSRSPGTVASPLINTSDDAIDEREAEDDREEYVDVHGDEASSRAGATPSAPSNGVTSSAGKAEGAPIKRMMPSVPAVSLVHTRLAPSAASDQAQLTVHRNGHQHGGALKLDESFEGFSAATSEPSISSPKSNGHASSPIQVDARSNGVAPRTATELPPAVEPDAPRDASTNATDPEEDGHDRPIQVRCLGAFVVQNGDRVLQPVGKEGASYRAWELLALLAVRPDGALKKEQILAALWPAAEEDASFNSVQKVASRLRDALQDQVPGLPKEAILGERDGTYRLNPEFIWSDARSFAALCASAPKLPSGEAIAALQEARRLYRGELLADQAYPWITKRQAGLVPRLYYADRYRQATCRLARLLCEAGQPLRAVELYKALLKNEPTLEDVVRGLFRCYQQLGDLASLIREERELRQALAESLGKAKDASAAEPSMETTLLFRQIRAELEARSRPKQPAPQLSLNDRRPAAR